MQAIVTVMLRLYCIEKSCLSETLQCKRLELCFGSKSLVVELVHLSFKSEDAALRRSETVARIKEECDGLKNCSKMK